MRHFMVFCIGLGIVTFLARLLGIINTPWIWTLSPLWGFITFISLIGFLAILGGFLTGIFKVVRGLRYHHQIQKRLNSLQSQEA